jgi:hypothetical protein
MPRRDGLGDHRHRANRAFQTHASGRLGRAKIDDPACRFLGGSGDYRAKEGL